MDCSPPDSSVPEILQARTLESVAMPFSMGSPQLWDQNPASLALQEDFLPTESSGESLCPFHFFSICLHLYICLYLNFEIDLKSIHSLISFFHLICCHSLTSTLKNTDFGPWKLSFFLNQVQARYTVQRNMRPSQSTLPLNIFSLASLRVPW